MEKNQFHHGDTEDTKVVKDLSSRSEARDLLLRVLPDSRFLIRGGLGMNHE